MHIDPSYSFYYIDPSIVVEGTPGDGSSPASANNTFPETLTDNTVYLIRCTKFETKLNNEEVIETYCPLPRGTWSLNRFAIIGMPKSTDELYQDMPADAKEAWGADTEEYAQVTLNNSNHVDYQFAINNCYRFQMFRIQLMGNNSDNNERYGYMINFNNNCVVDAEIVKCYFKNKNYDLIDTSKVTYTSRWRGNEYINFDNDTCSSVIKFDNCVIEHAGERPAFYIDKTHNVVLTNITVYATLYYDSADTSCFYIVRDSEFKHNLYMRNIKYYPVYGPGDYVQYVRRFIYDRTVAYADIDGFTSSIINKDGYSFHDAGVRPLIDIIIHSASSIIKNINISNPYVNGLNSRFISIVTEVNSYMTLTEGQYITVDNITLNASANRVGTENCNYNFSNPWDENGNGGLLYLEITREYRDRTQASPSNLYLLSNCVINAYAGQAMRVRNALINLESVDIKGAVWTADCIGKIKSISTWYPGSAFNDGEFNLMYIGSITCNRANTTFPYNGHEALNKSWRSKILVGQTNTKFTNLSSTTNNDNYRQNNKCMYVCTSNTTTGNYTVVTINSYAQTWSIFRNGGTQCSIKCVNECASNEARPLVLGGAPFKGFKFTCPSGQRTLKIYLTTFNYNIPSDISKHLKAKIFLPDGQIVWSPIAGYWKDDNSTWNNVDNDVKFRLEVPVKSATAGDAYIEYYFDFYQNDAATYLDPYPIIG